MPRYLVLDADWLDHEIRTAEVLRRHAQDTGKPIAIAASAVRAESLKEVRRLAVEAAPSAAGPIVLSIPAPPAAPSAEEE